VTLDPDARVAGGGAPAELAVEEAENGCFVH
jgi:hypothetical protein